MKIVGSLCIAAHAFALANGSIVERAYLKASNTQSGDRFGLRVAVSGDTLVVATPYESSNATGIDGNSLDNSAPESGAAYVFVRSGASWIQQAYLKASNTGAGDWFGTSVSISGDTIVVGAAAEDSGATGIDGNQADESNPDGGAAYVFTRNGNTWTQQAYLKPSNYGGDFGLSVAVSRDSVVVGAIAEASSSTGVNGNQASTSAPFSGAAYVFVRSGTAWSQQAYLKASNTGSDDSFGYSVAISGDSVVVGAPYEESNAVGINGNGANNAFYASGAAYSFVRTGTTWAQEAYIKASNTRPGAFFGVSVAVSNDTILVGSMLEKSNATGVNGNQLDSSMTDAGAAYVFTRSAGTWSQQAYLKASNTGTVDYFGRSVSIDGDAAIIGAWGEDSGATLVDGNQLDESAGFAGAAYVFSRSGTAWSQSAYLKAPNAETGDGLGVFVAIDGQSIVVGAPEEDSASIGAAGSPADNGASNAGAVYVFEILSTPQSYCLGDGTAQSCPCGNNGSVGSGCSNSSYSGGSQLTTTGGAGTSLSTDTLNLIATSASGPCLFAQGSSQYPGALGVSFGDALLCVTGSIVRLGVVFPSVSGTAVYPDVANPVPIHVAGATANGDVRYYQCWYRDAVSYCTSATFNLSPGVTVSWLP